MDAQVRFWVIFGVLFLLVFFFDRKCMMLRDISSANKKPYSFSRVQLAWWSVIVLASFISILFFGDIPTFHQSTLILLGISIVTTAAARITDISDQASHGSNLIQNQNSENFFLDILSDGNGVSIHRFQTVIFNFTLGVWFICAVVHNLDQFARHITTVVPDINWIIPDLSPNNLVLLGLSSGTYAALKATENKSAPPLASQNTQPEVVQDEALVPGMKGVG